MADRRLQCLLEASKAGFTLRYDPPASRGLMWISESWWSWKINMSTELFWNCFFVHFFQYYKCLLYRGHLYWSVFRAGKYRVEILLFCSRHFIGWRKNVEIYCLRFPSRLVNFARVTNYMLPYPYPPRVETLCIGIISVLIQVMCYSQMPLSIFLTSFLSGLKWANQTFRTSVNTL